MNLTDLFLAYEFFINHINPQLKKVKLKEPA
jgi:hypothetical protein